MTSYEKTEDLIEYVLMNDRFNAMLLVKDMYEKYPKEEDCITSIILDTLVEELSGRDSQKKLALDLIHFLEYLKSAKKS